MVRWLACCSVNWPGMCTSSRVCATGHTQDLVALVEKSRASCPCGRFPPVVSFVN